MALRDDPPRIAATCRMIGDGIARDCFVPIPNVSIPVDAATSTEAGMRAVLDRLFPAPFHSALRAKYPRWFGPGPGVVD